MKNLRLFIGVLAVAIVLMCFWFRQRQGDAVSQEIVPATEAPGNSVSPNPTVEPTTETSSNTQAGNPSTASSTRPTSIHEYMLNRQADPNFDWKQPINFYGKVVDENNTPVGDADVHFKWNDISENGTSVVDCIVPAKGDRGRGRARFGGLWDRPSLGSFGPASGVGRFQRGVYIK